MMFLFRKDTAPVTSTGRTRVRSLMPTVMLLLMVALLITASFIPNTPGIIKYPFWHCTYANQDATYACVNYGEAYAHPHIRDRSILIDADIDQVLGDLLGGQDG